MIQPLEVVPGFDLWPSLLSPQVQAELIADVLQAAETAPFANYATAYGKAMSVGMTSFGPL
ncbi:MAG: alkylated DNA repair dioxygenase, partial [Caulobacter sp. 35-67-4]